MLFAFTKHNTRPKTYSHHDRDQSIILNTMACLLKSLHKKTSLWRDSKKKEKSRLTATEKHRPVSPKREKVFPPFHRMLLRRKEKSPWLEVCKQLIQIDVIVYHQRFSFVMGRDFLTVYWLTVAMADWGVAMTTLPIKPAVSHASLEMLTVNVPWIVNRGMRFLLVCVYFFFPSFLSPLRPPRFGSNVGSGVRKYLFNHSILWFYT